MTAPTSEVSAGLTAAEAAQSSQAGLAAVVARSLGAALPLLRSGDSRSIELFTKAMQAVVRKYAAAAVTLAARHYAQARAAAGVRGSFTPSTAPLPSADDVQAAVEWPLSKQLSSGTVDVDELQRQVVLSAEKLVQDAARDTVIGNVRKDRQVSAYYRQTHPESSRTGTCSFCAMLASRGAVYTKGTAGFKAHLGCKCQPEPVFKGYKPSAQVKAWDDMWRTATRGKSGANARAAFRQAYEGRDVTGLTRGPHARKRSGGSGRRPARGSSEPSRPSITPEQARETIASLEQTNARAAGNPKLAKMVAFNLTSIAKLREIAG